MIESDDDETQLSAYALAALNEFYAERKEKEEQLQKLVNNQGDNQQIPDVRFDEDWQLSQFWYNDSTVQTIVKVALKITNANARIALISCPTLYASLASGAENQKIKLFEYDNRFSVYGTNFIPYDYKNPLSVPKEMVNSFDLVIADPPFLSDECFEKVARTIKFLAKKHIFICTGAIMADLVEKLLGVKKCNFLPQHTNNLANEFWCYANFDFDSLIQ